MKQLGLFVTLVLCLTFGVASAEERGEDLPVMTITPPYCPISFHMALDSITIRDPHISAESHDPHAGQLQYSVQFENVSDKPIVAIALEYTAGSKGNEAEKVFPLSLEQPLPPEKSQVITFWGAPVSRVGEKTSLHSISVYAVTFADGSVWTASDAQEESPRPSVAPGDAAQSQQENVGDIISGSILARSLKDVPPNSQFAAVFEAIDDTKCQGEEPSSRCLLRAKVAEFIGGALPSTCPWSQPCEIVLDLGPKSGQVFKISRGDRLTAIAVRSDADVSVYLTPMLTMNTSQEEITRLRRSMKSVNGKSD